MSSDTTFRVLVDVIEIQNIIWPAPSENVKSKLPNPLVEVVIADHCNSTTTREATASCTFNRTFLFHNIQVAENLQASVYHKGFLGKKELIGSCRIQLSTVRSTNEHRILRAFYTLVHPDKPSEPRGFIRLSIHVLKPGELLKSTDTYTSPNIQETSTRSLTQAFQKETSQLTFDVYHFTIYIHFGQDILKNFFLSNEQLPSSHVEIHFMETRLKTPVCRETYDPNWSIGLRFLATVPCADDTVTIELWSDGTTSERESFIKLSFMQILKLTKSTRWINFYTDCEMIYSQSKKDIRNPLAMFASLFELDDDEMNFSENVTDLKYLGRILISTLVKKKKFSSVATTVPGFKIVSPLDQKIILWMDFFLLSGVEKYADLVMTLSLGDWETSVELTERLDDCLRFTDEQGRIPEQIFFLPVNLEMACDLLIKVFGHRISSSTTSLVAENQSKRFFIAYARIPVLSLVKRDNIPFWIKLINVDPKMLQKSSVPNKTKTASISMSLLANVITRTPEEIKKKKTTRPSRVECKVERYVCHMICYQVVNLPVLANAFPDPYILVSLGGGSAKTQTIVSTLQPDFYEMISFYLSLPEHVKLSRELWIQVFSKNCLLGETCIPVEFLLSDSARLPQWYPLTCQQFEKNQTRVLCSINLTCLTNQTAQFIQELPKTIRWFQIEYQPYDVTLFIIGCRLFPNAAQYMGENIKNIQIQIEFGREPKNLNRRLWYGSCEEIVQGSCGNFNFFFRFKVKCFLPTSELFQTFVEFHVYYFYDGECYEIGIAYLHLTPEIKSFSSKLREKIKAEFEYFSPLIEEIIPWRFNTHMASHNTFLSPCANLSKTCRTLPHDSDFEILENAWLADFTGDESSDALPFSDFKPLEKLEPNTYNLYTSEVDVFCSSDTQKLRETIKTSKYLDSMKEFVWCQTPESIDKTYDELNYPAEFELPFDDLPYSILPIFSPDGTNSVVGNPGVVGLLKLHCAVFTADENTTDHEKSLDMLSQQLSTGPLKVRVHVKSATGLCTGEKDEGEWFLVVKSCNSLSNTLNKIHEIKDVHNTRKGFAPDFYRSFELDAEFPQNAILTVGISTGETLWSSSKIFGQTYIDLENRFFHPNFSTLMKNNDNSVLVETRCLRDLTNHEPVGHIRLWVEILREAEALARPMIPIMLTPQQSVQVRVVIWKLKAATQEKFETASLYVVGIMSDSTTDSMIIHDTDTNWNSSNTSAAFNWRFLFNILVPSEAVQLKLQIWGRNLMTAHDALAETVLDMSHDLIACKNSMKPIHLKRTWVQMYHPVHASQLMGHLDIEISIVPQEYALDNPVGIGREAPNKDPFLPTVKDNRNYLASSSIGQTIFGTSDKILYGAQICSWLITFGIFLSLYLVISKLFL